MKTAAILAMSALLTYSQVSIAQQNDQPAGAAQQPTGKIEPGTEATGAMSDQVPQMKEDCADAAQAGNKAPGTEATGAMSKQVPTMTADQGDCVDTGAAKKTN